jgi:hypothetical protein
MLQLCPAGMIPVALPEHTRNESRVHEKSLRPDGGNVTPPNCHADAVWLVTV